MRLFVAIDINDINIEKLQHSLVKKFNFNSQYVKPIKKNNLHLTLKFLGEKTDFEAKDIISDLSKINFTSFNIVFNNIGVFPHIRSPRIIWIGLDDESNRKLNDIYLQLNSVLQKYDNIENEVNTISLKKSILTPNGSIYYDLFNIYANKRNA